MLDLSIPAVHKLWAWPAWWTQLSVGKIHSLVFAHTSFPSRDRRSVEPRADALQPPPSGKRGADLLAFWNGVKRHLGGGGRPRRPAGFEAAAIRGAPAGWGARCGGTPQARRAPPAGSVPSPRGLRAGRGAGRRQCPRGGSGRPRARRAAVRLAAGSGHRRTPGGGGGHGARRRGGGGAGGVRARSHTRSHTHIHTASYTLTHAPARTRGAQAEREEARRGSAAAAAAAAGVPRRAGGRAGGRPRSRLTASVRPHGPRPRTRPRGVARPHALQRRRATRGSGRL